MKSRWSVILLGMVILAGCGNRSETGNPPPANLPAVWPERSEGQPERLSVERRYPAYAWPDYFVLPLDIRFVTEEPPPEVAGPTILRR